MSVWTTIVPGQMYGKHKDRRAQELVDALLDLAQHDREIYRHLRMVAYQRIEKIGLRSIISNKQN